MKLLRDASFGAVTFCASRHKNEECGINGLPLTPNSIRILGRFQYLTTLNHKNLSSYLDLIRGKHERVFIVSEYYERNLEDVLKSNPSVKEIIKYTKDILCGLSYLNDHDIIHSFLSLSCLLVSKENRIIICNYGLHHITESGSSVSFPIGYPKYSAPEVLLRQLRHTQKSSLHQQQQQQQQLMSEKEETSSSNANNRNWVEDGCKRDVWSLGIIIFELLLKKKLWSKLSLKEVLRNVFRFLVDRGGCPQLVWDFIRSCLNLRPSERCAMAAVVATVVVAVLSLLLLILFYLVSFRFSSSLLSHHHRTNFNNQDHDNDLLSECDMHQVYNIWKLAGGDVEALFKKSGRISRKAPIINLPCLIMEEGESLGSPFDSSTLFDDHFLLLPLDHARERLSGMDVRAFYPTFEFDRDATSSLVTSTSGCDLKEIVKLPLVIRENDVEYQFHRIIKFKRLLEGYPYQRQRIFKECRVDIPPLYRNFLWAAILKIEGDVRGRYEAIDKETPTPTDRQIEVDIPRCHQYNPLLSSPTGHLKFKRLLKAWVASHPELVYWQGLDSLCAPFLYLNFNDEALAFACLSSFIPKYLHGFFLKDNAHIIQEYLAVFTHLITFHDPILSNHMQSISFIPDLYSIPWFLTMYAHVFPLHKIFHLWDTLLLGNSSFPLCVGVAILKQLRNQLLTFDFNECILLFSDMPEIDMEKCVEDSIQIFCSTPRSVTYRQYDGPPTNQTSTSTQQQPIKTFHLNDYSVKTHLSIDGLTLNELKCEKCARISAEDVINLMEIKQTNNNINNNNVQNNNNKCNNINNKTGSDESHIVILDVRDRQR
ncbi:hypothetical protein HELRODRAFT_113661 [Helobdella robusta]|uniref:Protein kinase domain-containing protein n=1 Tax=Helobdella robusta TaxID=6412 RepID=T1EFU8_HELRO|nr:hypothetical protein HELRODRAFT_113661 [Helobdella robusta]ESN99565.1 hypothetical protein HELRODRAFT_113661 [Helobdella robusta]